MSSKGRRGRDMTAAAALCAAFIAGAAPAQTIYRCGGDARHLSDRPCRADDAAIQIDVDRPDAARQHEAAEVAKREAALAERLRGERHQRESAPAAGAAGFGASAPPLPVAKKPRPKKPKTVRLPAEKAKRIKKAG